MRIKPIVVKEFWQYFSNKNLIVLSTNALVILVIGLLLIMTGPQYLTPYSKQVAINQISENPSVFGLSKEDVARMGESAITFASLVSQLPVIIILASALSSYVSMVASLFHEKSNKTMEILFSSPLSESEILLGKLLSGLLFSLLSWGSNFVAVLGLLQYLHLKTLGSMWIPTKYFLVIAVFVPFSMIFLSISVGLIVSIKIKSPELVNVISFPLVLVPIVISFISYRMRLEGVLQVYMLLGTVSIVVSLITAMFGKRVINRLVFITN
ncbi:ABC transporter permease [Thermococcus sp.]|uniref:ABC transporter permease n=1 Tax=Thermococcus sp. TaxID=35749 RepID=UPI002626EFEC|nr:ABC transporter permease [Thermococcus sp.]